MKSWLLSAFSRAPQTKSGASGSNQLIALQLAGAAKWSPRHYGSLVREGYQRNAIAYRCIRMIAEAAASVELCVQMDEACPEDGLAKKLLQNPNPKMSRAEFFEAHYGYLQLSGDAFLQLALVDDVPNALFTLRPDRMRAVNGNDGWPQAWEYEVSGQRRRFPRGPPTFLLKHRDFYGLDRFSPAQCGTD